MYKCPYCSMTKESENPSNMKRHIRSKHTGERPHICPICHATFTRKDVMKAHANKKHGN